METQRQTSLGCLRSTHKPVVGLIFQSTLLLRRAPFCPCPASVAVNWDFCPHGAYILLRLRHLINKWVNKCISNGGTYNGGKFKHGAGERECRDSADLLGGPGKPAFSWAFEQRCPWTVSAPYCSWKEHPWQFKGHEKKTAWHCRAVAKGPMWPEWSKLGSHRRWG